MKVVFYLFLTVSFGSFLGCQKDSRASSNSEPHPTAGTIDSPTTNSHDPSRLSAGEYEALLPIVGKEKIIIIRDRTAGDFLGETSLNAKIFPGIRQEIVDDFNRRNKESLTVECRFPSEYQCTVLSGDVIKAMSDFSKENATEKWRNFREKYGTDHYYTVSRVGFSTDGQQALAFVSSTCGTLCAEGTYYLLTKQDGRWQVSEEKNVWVS